MNLYKFTFTAILVARDYHKEEDLIRAAKVIQDAYEKNFANDVLLDTCTIKLD